MRRLFSLLILIFLGLSKSQAQTSLPGPDRSKWGTNDTLVVPAIYYDGEWMPYRELEMVYVSNVSPEKLVKILQEYNRLRNAVYVTYPYAKTAGAVIND